MSLEPKNVIKLPEADISFIHVRTRPIDLPVYLFAEDDVEIERTVKGLGHVGNSMPRLQAIWEADALSIKSASLMSAVCDRDGLIVRRYLCNVKAQDVNLQGIEGYEVSFGSRIGMSGGPLLDAATNDVIGLLSFGLPANATEKTRTFAVSIGEIVRRI